MNELVARWLVGDGMTLAASQRTTHAYVIGQPGTGKSFAMESWAMQDIRQGRGVGVMDVHGDVFYNMLARVALRAQIQPQLAERVVVIDPSNPIWTVGFNPLEAMPGVSPERLSSFLADVIVKIWKINPAESPRMMWLLTHTFQALAECGLSLLELPRFLSDRAWRISLLQHGRSRQVTDYFGYEFPKSDSAVPQWITPVLNKIGPLIHDPEIRLMLSGRSTFTFRKILDGELVLLVNLSKGMLTEGNSALLGAFFTAHLQQAALARAKTRLRRPFYLYLDEFQNYTTDNIKDVLSESRKYALSLTLAHQYLDQLSADLRGAVLNTTGTIACFRVGHADAAALAKEIFPPDFLSRYQPEQHLRGWGRFLSPFVEMDSSVAAQEALITLLTSLKMREFWVKRRGPYRPIKQRSLDMPVPTQSRELYGAVKQLLSISGARYGRLKTDAQKEQHEQHSTRAESTTSYEKA
jgi:hypothetical protein